MQYVPQTDNGSRLAMDPETAKHHLNPSSGEAKNGHPQQLAWTNAKRQPLGNGCGNSKTPPKSEAQAKQKTVIRKGPKSHLWNP